MSIRVEWIILAVMLVAGCTHTRVIKTISDTELGYATLCTWEHHQPTHCIADPTRSTINDNFLQQLLDELNASRKDEYKRRAL